MSTETVFTDDQLKLLRSIYVSNIVGGLPNNQVLQLASATLLSNYSELSTFDLKDRVISETNSEMWNAVVERLKAIEEASKNDSQGSTGSN